MKRNAFEPPDGPDTKRALPSVSQALQPAASAVALPVEVCRQAPARAIVNLAALRHNIRVLQKICTDLGSRPMPVLKADAYGHGAVRVAQELATCGVSAFRHSHSR